MCVSDRRAKKKEQLVNILIIVRRSMQQLGQFVAWCATVLLNWQ